MEQRHRCIVKYQVATYSGEEVVYCDANDDNDFIIGKCKRQLRQKSGFDFPYGYQSFKIVERENYYGD